MEIKPIIYQLFPRLFTNTCATPVACGTIEQNGAGKMNHITSHVLGALKTLGVTHVWYTGVIEHATKTSYAAHGIAPCNPHVVKGNAGSPYAIIDYYDVDPDIAEDVERRNEELDALVARTHEAGLKVVLDFVPNHVAREYHSDRKPAGTQDLGEGDDSGLAFSPHNNFYYLPGQEFTPHIDLGSGEQRYREFPARATGNDCFHASPGVNDWYETIKLNYGVDYTGGSGCHFSPTPRTWHMMLDILLHWAGRGVDAFRCDMVHMVPVEFWHYAIGEVKRQYSHVVFIAELYDTGLYHRYIHEGGFDYLYNKVTLYDTLRAVINGHAAARDITRCWQLLEGVEDHMLNFLENHDEQRIASPQFAGDAFKALPALVVSATMSRCPFMIYAGQELGESAPDAEGFSGHDGRTTIFDYWSVGTLRRWYNKGKCDTSRLTAAERRLRKAYKRVLNLCNSEAAIAQGTFFDLMYVNETTLNPHRHFAYLRHHDKDLLLVVANFDDAPCHAGVNIPAHAFDFLHIKPGKCVAKELLHGDSKVATLTPREAFTVDVEPHSAVMWKIKITLKD